MSRAPHQESRRSTTPDEYAASTPQLGARDHSFTLQAIMEMQKSLGNLTARTDTLITEVQGQKAKLDGILHQVSFIKGGLFMTAVAFGLLIAGVSWLLSFKWDNLVAALKILSDGLNK